MSQCAPRFRFAVLLFFVGSGAAGLVLEVVWTRSLGAVFGNTVYAASTVLTVFMLGLALGGAVWGRIADRHGRPLVLYGCLELGIGAYAMLFPLLAAACGALYGWFYRAVAPGETLLTTFRFLVSSLLLLPPTFLMGGTLPVLGRYLGGGHREPGQQVGYLYGANTAGAVAGCLLAGFVLLEMLGVRGSIWAAGGLAMTIGLLALAINRRSAMGKESDRQPAETETHEVRPPVCETAATPKALPVPTFRRLLAALAGAGFCALAYEVLWTQVLIFIVMTSVYSFAMMLGAFLTGLAVGSLVSSRLLVPRLRRPILWFGIVEVLVGVSALLTIPLLARLDSIDVWIVQHLPGGGAWQPILVRLADAFVVLLLPTLWMGVAFPVATAACLRGELRLGAQIGAIYAANTVGCVLGSFAGGFLLLPALGTHRSLLVVVALNLAIGVALIWQAAGRRIWLRCAVAAPAAALVAAAFLLTPADVFYKTINAFHNPSQVVFLKEHPTGIVAVHDLPNGERLISVCGIDVAGRDFMLRSTQKLQAYIPLCLHRNPRRVVQIGFGCGETARVGLEFGVEHYTVVEICPAVLEAGQFFEDLNRGSYRDPRIRKIIMDGKNFALLAGEQFDVIMNDSAYPGSSGSSALYTVDHFRNCRQRLAEGGLFSCWVPLDLRPSELKMILRSFQEVFPHTSFWVASNCLNKHGLILGSLVPLEIDFARLEKLLGREDIAADLRAIAINDVYDLLDCHVCDEARIEKMTADAPLNTDDRPRLAFSCALRTSPEQCLKSVLAMIERHHAPITPCVTNFTHPAGDKAELARRFEATQHIFRAQVAQLSGLASVRQRELALANQINPGDAHVASCQEELEREIRDMQAELADRPQDRLLAQRLADHLLMAERYPEARKLYEQLLRVGPAAVPEVLVRLAEARFRLGEATAAEEVLLQCLALYPNWAQAHDRLAELCLRSGRREIAEQHIAEALRLEPDNPLYQSHSQAIRGGMPSRGR